MKGTPKKIKFDETIQDLTISNSEDPKVVSLITN